MTYPDLLAAISKEFPGFRVVKKSSWFWRALHWIVLVVTFGGNRRFNQYITTIGKIVAVPLDWDTRDEKRRMAVMRHERIHLRQQARWGFGSVWLGLLPFGLCYVFLPLPLGFAYFRYRFEREAYAESIRAAREYWGENGASGSLENSIKQLTGPAYAYTWPFPGAVRRWLMENSR